MKFNISDIKNVLLILLAAVLIVSCGEAEDDEDNSTFRREEIEWREARHRAMKDSTSWLTIAGLFWLEEGENTFGAAAGNDVRLPGDSSPPEAGVFILKNEEVTVELGRGVDATINGSAVRRKGMKPDSEGDPDRLEMDGLRLWIIERSGRFAVRLRDLDAPRYRNYHGLEFFPPRKDYRVTGRFVPFDSVKTVTVPTVVGTVTEMKSPGYVTFRLKGRKLRLDVFGGSRNTGEFFIIMRDKTSGEETYGGCRYLTAPVLDDGRVELNFNRAVNPPCAYTPYATCPLPPPENNLPVRVGAGEKIYRKHH